MRVLAVGAHPDDIEILCAGTLLRYRQQGHEVIICVATNGEQGHFVLKPEELRYLLPTAPTGAGQAEGSIAGPALLRPSVAGLAACNSWAGASVSEADEWAQRSADFGSMALPRYQHLRPSMMR